MTTIIGLVGNKGSGKDTAADWMLKEFFSGTKVAFADPMKEAVAAMLGCDSVEAMEQEFGKEDPIPFLRGVSLRRIYQTLGTEWGRKLIHPNLWIKLMDRRIAKMEKAGFDFIVVSDVRFENEAKYLRDRLATLIFIERPQPRKFRSWWAREHISEKGVARLPWETLIKNDSSLQVFLDKVRRCSLELLLGS